MSAKFYEMPHSAKLSEKELKFITALLATPTLEAACKKMRISHETGRLWLQKPHIKAAYEEACRQVFAVELQRLQRIVSQAITLLVDTLTGPEPNATRVRAAQILLEKSIEINKVSELEARLAKLEAGAKEGEKTDESTRRYG